ncbi:hypothetical protein D9611_010232 [Ephemerocybe angulata]|uniref:Uncharacterized protein n=1 Tax=Ephemerocybe angulata TaxID=980116 RepID=A0A8H5EVM6_9AGAR|nr:hypothetical protein D9611_010232 [Tulosesus angulatus]
MPAQNRLNQPEPSQSLASSEEPMPSSQYEFEQSFTHGRTRSPSPPLLRADARIQPCTYTHYEEKKRWPSKPRANIAPRGSSPSLPAPKRPRTASNSSLSKSPSTLMINTCFRPWASTRDTISITALIDSGATNCYMDKEFVSLHKFPTRILADPLNIYNADGSENTSGCITSTCTMPVQIATHTENLCFYVTSLNHPVILGFAWLARHNPEINWRTRTIAFSRCPPVCYKNLAPPIIEPPNPFINLHLDHPRSPLEFEDGPNVEQSTSNEQRSNEGRSKPVGKRPREPEITSTSTTRKTRGTHPRRSVRQKERKTAEAGERRRGQGR